MQVYQGWDNSSRRFWHCSRAWVGKTPCPLSFIMLWFNNVITVSAVLRTTRYLRFRAMGGSPSYSPISRVHQLPWGCCHLQPKARTHVGIGFSRSDIYQRRRWTGDRTNGGEDEHRLWGRVLQLSVPWKDGQHSTSNFTPPPSDPTPPPSGYYMPSKHSGGSMMSGFSGYYSYN
jgi:hypothetical protein